MCDSRLEVDVLPPQAQDLALTHSGFQGQHYDAVQLMVGVGVAVPQNLPLFARREPTVSAWWSFWFANVLHGVAVAIPPLDPRNVKKTGEQGQLKTHRRRREQFSGADVGGCQPLVTITRDIDTRNRPNDLVTEE